MISYKILRRLQDFSIKNVNNSSSQNAIADNLLTFLLSEKIDDYTHEELALYCNVSSATFSRFVRDLGYNNFKEFKQAVSSNQKEYLLKHSYSPFSINSFSEQIIAHIQETAAMLEAQNLEEIVQTIISNQDIFLLGIHYSEMLLKELQYKLLKVGKRVYWSEGVLNQLEFLNSVPDGAVCIFFSFSGRFIQSTLPFLLSHEKDIKTYLVTSKNNAKFESFFTETIYISNHSDKGNKQFQLQFFVEVLLEYIKRALT